MEVPLLQGRGRLAAIRAVPGKQLTFFNFSGWGPAKIRAKNIHYAMRHEIVLFRFVFGQFA
ncbi:hypothetical protein FGG78_17465 [Thioclava sp. BHET1]|uniref:hypothetical protein n=1 Tax=Thioclava dalianensis TaxID=1185766 RepID=UPI000AE4FD3B|nr:hypothetical protein [Thioclava dalianensis]TMV88259.1 hypothetical protein FGG78_17465 [Thioclava sp. BHET1]